MATHCSQGSPGGNYVPDPVFGIAATADGKGYWLLGAGGELYTYGDAVNYGTHSTSALDDPVIGIVATSDGKGYWEYTPDGDVYPFGDANGHGSLTGMHAQPTDRRLWPPTSNNKGYWLVASDGGIFTFGDATIQRVPGRPEPRGPDRGHRGDPGRRWLLAGGQHRGRCTASAMPHVFPGPPIPSGSTYIEGLVPTSTGKGYWLYGILGDVYSYGDALTYGLNN